MLLEARVIWAGAIRAGDLRDAFDITTGKAEKDIARYRERCPQNLAQDRETGEWRPTDRFEPAFLRGTAEELLQVLRNHDIAADLPLAMAAAGHVAAESLELPTRSFDVRVLVRINSAIRERRSLAVEYQSMSKPEPRRIEIAPHVLVFTGRWHARAWSESHQGFRDFLLSRMCSLPELRAAAARGGDQDWDWQHQVSVRIVPHPGLSAAQQRVVMQDYGMAQGMLEKRVRLALVPYYLRLLNVGEGDRNRSASEQQIVLLNVEELRSFDRLS
jgi:predicted DNA-binding transcriptional regulator YafY